MSVLTPLGFSLLRQLSDGAFHSGEDLAATVGLTRARVSQLLKQAETAGLSLERVRGPGLPPHRGPGFPERRRGPQGPARPGRQGRVVPAARSRGRRPDRLHLDRAPAPRRSAATSTAASWPRNGRAPDAAAAARPGPPSPAAASRFPWAGGTSRARASWPACRSRWASPCAARSTPRASPGVELKWPNDLVHKHLKVGGILVELNGDALGPVDGRRRRRPQRAPARRDPPQHRAAGQRPHHGRRTRRAGHRSQSPAGARGRGARRHARRLLAAPAFPRSPPNGSVATPTRASR